MYSIFRPALLVFVIAIAMRLHAGEHPVPLEKDVDAAKCLECHEEKSKGTHVHSAISMGCTTCHEVKVEKDATTINLTSPPEELCVTCHEKAKETTMHGPYDQGRCVLCHDPHTSEFENQLRAPANSLCLECHQDRSITGSLKVFKTDHEFSEAEFQGIPKIGLDPTLKMGHPMGMHKVADAPDLLHPGQKISCLSCHEHHAAAREKLVRTVEIKKKKMDVCDSCHLANDEMRMAEAQKRSDQLEAKRLKEEQLQAKQPNIMPRKMQKGSSPK